MSFTVLVLWLFATAGATYLAREAEILDAVRGRLLARTSRVGRFVRSMLECAPCTAAWLAGPVAGVVVPPAMLLPWWWWLTAASFTALPLAIMGFLWTVAVLSPVQAAAQRTGERDGEAKGT